VLTVSRSDGSEKRWRVPLTAQTPRGAEDLKRALVSQFIGESADPRNWTLVLSGTAGSPAFDLHEAPQLFGAAEPLD
jgi:hypothetical protein